MSPPADQHPIERFQAPRAIQQGQALKDLLDAKLVALIGASFAQVLPAFSLQRFRRQACDGLTAHELSGRAQHIAQALQAQLPSDPKAALAILVASLGPPLTGSGEIGLRPFFYLPHSQLLAALGPQAIDAGLDACRELTRRFTAEFAIRPLLLADCPRVLARLRRWTSDADPHVRRLVSEGTRPRLPWASRLPMFIADPAPTLALLERLHRDTHRYVQRSVANHLGDIAKDHLEIVLATCSRWLHDSDGMSEAARNDLRWLIRHALRHPDKRGDARAKALRLQAGGRRPRRPA